VLDVLRESDRAIWATALYAGLRRGELRALRWEDVDLGGGLIRVERGWDDREGPIGLKSKAGRRRVPIARESFATSCSRTSSKPDEMMASSSARTARRPSTQES